MSGRGFDTRQGRRGHRFGATLNANTAAGLRFTHNNRRAAAAKLDLRRRVLAAIGPAAAHVLDLFAGTGVMRAAWAGAASYLGIDHVRHPGADAAIVVADNLDVLREWDLTRFTVFDFDAFGAPWEQVGVLAARRPVRPGERIALVLTDGCGMYLKLGGVPRCLAGLVGAPLRMGGANRVHDALINEALRGTAQRMGAMVSRLWKCALGSQSEMRYLGAILTGLA